MNLPMKPLSCANRMALEAIIDSFVDALCPQSPISLAQKHFGVSHARPLDDAKRQGVLDDHSAGHWENASRMISLIQWGFLDRCAKILQVERFGNSLAQCIFRYSQMALSPLKSSISQGI